MATGISSVEGPLSPGVAAAVDPDRFQAGRVSVVVTGHAVHDTYTAFLPALLPVLITRFALSTTQAGLLSVCLQWPSILQPFIGYLADRRGLRFAVILAPAVTGAAMSLLGLAPSYLAMAMLLICAGLAAACLHSVGPAIVGRLSGASLGRGMGLWMVGGGLGYTVGPIIIVAALNAFTLEGTTWLMVGGFVASGLLFLGLRGVPDHVAGAAPARPWRQALRTLRPLALPVIGITLARSFASASLSTFLPTFLSSEGAGLFLAGASLSVFEAAGMAGALMAGTLSDQLGRRSVVGMAMMALPPLMLVFLLMQGLIRFPLLIALGFITLSVTPVIMALLQEWLPENRALATGIFMGFNFVVQAAATVAIGALADWLGLRAAFTISAVVPLLGLPLVLLLPKGKAGSD